MAGNNIPPKSRRLAVQMYTVRDFTATGKEFSETLQKIARMGYTGVQISAAKAIESGELSAKNVRQMLDDNGLVCAATHRSWQALSEHTDAEIESHQTLGCDFTAIGSLPGLFGGGIDADGYRRFLTEAKPVIERLKSAGIRFGYHNHQFEFARMEAGAQTRPVLFDIFVDEGGADLCLELDLYWAWEAGVDPVALLGRSAGRLPLVHIKDREVVPGKGEIMAAIGEGNMPWETILPAGDAAGVGWYAVEQDVCPRDPFDCLRSSYDYLSSCAF
ncbi:MAG: sugar phosphate isomerase/epimerase [Fibrella sp.]|nr:sugar phosphate isomerase/epimerase [Armatimonadota bacterium]